MLSLIVSALLATVAVAEVFSSACSRTYTVVEGDYCDTISAKNNASSYQIARANIGTINAACSNLEVGQNICLGLVGSDCAKTYVVQEGDYCDLISSKFAINSTLLWTNNPQIDDQCYNLYVGQVLCVASEVLVSPAPVDWVLPGSDLGDDTTVETTTITIPGDYPATVDAGDSTSTTTDIPYVSTTTTTPYVSTPSPTSSSSSSSTPEPAPTPDNKGASNAVVENPNLDDCEDY